MSITTRASFKNSRINPRSATQTANTSKVAVPTLVNTLVATVNTSRTYLTLRNENTLAGDDLRFDYFDNAAILTEGFLLKASEAVDLESTQNIYCQAVTNAVTLSLDEGQG